MERLNLGEKSLNNLRSEIERTKEQIHELEFKGLSTTELDIRLLDLETRYQTELYQTEFKTE